MNDTQDTTRLEAARTALLHASVEAMASDFGFGVPGGVTLDDLDDAAREMVFARAQYDEDRSRAEPAYSPGPVIEGGCPACKQTPCLCG